MIKSQFAILLLSAAAIIASIFIFLIFKMNHHAQSKLTLRISVDTPKIKPEYFRIETTYRLSYATVPRTKNEGGLMGGLFEGITSPLRHIEETYTFDKSAESIFTIQIPKKLFRSYMLMQEADFDLETAKLVYDQCQSLIVAGKFESNPFIDKFDRNSCEVGILDFYRTLNDDGKWLMKGLPDIPVNNDKILHLKQNVFYGAGFRAFGYSEQSLADLKEINIQLSTQPFVAVTSAVGTLNDYLSLPDLGWNGQKHVTGSEMKIENGGYQLHLTPHSEIPLDISLIEPIYSAFSDEPEYRQYRYTILTEKKFIKSIIPLLKGSCAIPISFAGTMASAPNSIWVDNQLIRFPQEVDLEAFMNLPDEDDESDDLKKIKVDSSTFILKTGNPFSDVRYVVYGIFKKDNMPKDMGFCINAVPVLVR